MTTKKFRYQQQDCELTLRDGLEEYYEGHPGLLRPAQLSQESARFFRSHDRVHVVFGLDTTLDQEALADTWAMLGTDVGMRRYVKYLRTNQEAKQIFKEIGWAKTALISLRVTPKLFVVWMHARQMKKKWPWDGDESRMDTPIREIRRELGLRLID